MSSINLPITISEDSDDDYFQNVYSSKPYNDSIMICVSNPWFNFKDNGEVAEAEIERYCNIICIAHN